MSEPKSASAIVAVAFTPGGESLVALEDFGKTVKVYDAADGRLSRELPISGDRSHSLTISPDGRWLAAGSYNRGGSVISILNLKTGTLLGQLIAGTGSTPVFSADGDRAIVTGLNDRDFRSRSVRRDREDRGPRDRSAV